jgi:hypothetical protein
MILRPNKQLPEKQAVIEKLVYNREYALDLNQIYNRGSQISKIQGQIYTSSSTRGR